MKLILKLMVIFTTLLFLNSCEDIVDSDKNILITEIQYKSIKADQENSVVMPLEVGNKWYYDVYQYKTDGSLESFSLDSIEVLGEVLLQNEKWFEIDFPMLFDKNVFVSNTDLGLWVKCDDCFNKSFLLAKYPVSSGLFASGYTDLSKLTIQNYEYIEYLNTLLITKKSQNENITVPLGNYNCIKYTSNFQTDSAIINKYTFMNEYYAVDKGLVKIEQFQLLTDKLAKVFELRDKPKINDNNDCIETLDLNTDDIVINATHNEPVNLVNNSLDRITILEVYLESETPNGIITISNTFIESLPLVLLPGDFVTMEVLVNSNQKNRFFGIIKVIGNNGCFYEITLQGMSI